MNKTIWEFDSRIKIGLRRKKQSIVDVFLYGNLDYEFYNDEDDLGYDIPVSKDSLVELYYALQKELGFDK